MARILVVGKGSYGDMFPMFAIAQALKARGHTLTIAAEGHHEAATRSIDVPLIKLDAINSGSCPADANHRSFSQMLSGYELVRMLSPGNLETEYEMLLPAADNCDLIVGNQLAYAGSIARKKLKKPWVFCAPSPLAIPSFGAPPVFPYLHRLQALSSRHPGAQRFYLTIAREGSRLLMLNNIRLQRKLGIPDDGHPRFEGIYSDILNLLMTSPVLVNPQHDWPRPTVITGFCWFEPKFMQNDVQSERLAAFLQAGPPPIVFAPGGGARTQPGGFFTESIKAAKLLGIRSIIVAANRFHDKLTDSADNLITGYIPYSELIPHAAAIVHSGGIGTIGWSMRFGIPSLLSPVEWDQFDNAKRAEQNNLAAIIKQGSYSAKRVALALDKLLSDQLVKKTLEDQKIRVSVEDGTPIACARIESLLPGI